MTTKTIITLGRQFGSGGRAVGKKLAEDLGIPYYDKEILQRAAFVNLYSKITMKNQPAASYIPL